MAENTDIVKKIVEGIQDKKGRHITCIDLTDLHDAPCSHFVICEGDSNTQIGAITESIRDRVRDDLQEKPLAVDGLDNCLWVAMDYGQIIVHIFQRELPTFYDIEHLCADAKITDVPDLL